MDPPAGGTCSCSCLCCGPAAFPSSARRRDLKRRLDQLKDVDDVSPLLTLSSGDVSARVQIETEAAALRETLNTHQQNIQDMYEELEEERAAAATAASEAMSMILRLQREKAEVQMEFRQFKRFAEEKSSHDQQEIAMLEDLLFKRDQTIQALTCEIQAYKHRLMSFGFGPTLLSEPQTPNTATASEAAAAAFDYPQLKCKIPNDHDNDDVVAADLDKYAFGETPRDKIQNLEKRICQMERMPSFSHEKGVISLSPRNNWQSMESFGSSSFSMKGEDLPAAMDRISERDDESARVYTVDAVHCTPDSYTNTPRELGKDDTNKNWGDVDQGGFMNEEDEIKRLYARLQALEVDRETMRQTIMSMGTDTAQLVLLKEIAQHLYKEVTPQAQVLALKPQPQPWPPQQPKQMVKKPSFIRSFSIFAAMKWITSIVFWRKKALRTRYTFGITKNNAGLLMLLDKSPRMRQKRHVTRTLK